MKQDQAAFYMRASPNVYPNWSWNAIRQTGGAESSGEKAGSLGTCVFASVCAQSAFALAAKQNRTHNLMKLTVWAQRGPQLIIQSHKK